MGAISNVEREFIISGLRGQTQKLEALLGQLEDESKILDGSGWNHEDLIDVEKVLRKIRRIVQRYEN